MHTFVDNPRGLLTLTRHFSGSSGGKKKFRNPTYQMELPIDNRPNGGQIARSAIGVAGRNIRAVGHFADRFLPIPVGGLIGDYFNDTLNEWGEDVSNDVYQTDNRFVNGLMSFVDGQDRPGNVNKYTDKLGKFLLGNSDKITDGVKNLTDTYSEMKQYFGPGVGNPMSPMFKKFAHLMPNIKLRPDGLQIDQNRTLHRYDNLSNRRGDYSPYDNGFVQTLRKGSDIPSFDLDRTGTSYTPTKVSQGVQFARTLFSRHEDDVPISKQMQRQLNRDDRKKNQISSNDRIGQAVLATFDVGGNSLATSNLLLNTMSAQNIMSDEEEAMLLRRLYGK